MMKKTLKITGMTCKHCVHHVTVALSGLEGVTDVHVNLEANEAIVTVNGSVSDVTLKDAITEVGYTVIAIN